MQKQTTDHQGTKASRALEVLLAFLPKRMPQTISNGILNETEQRLIYISKDFQQICQQQKPSWVLSWLLGPQMWPQIWRNTICCCNTQGAKASTNVVVVSARVFAMKLHQCKCYLVNVYLRFIYTSFFRVRFHIKLGHFWEHIFLINQHA